MAIIIRHSTLSEKTQSAITGIISKNEWNDRHVIEGNIISEADVLFDPNSGHNHDGSNSRIADKVVKVQDAVNTSIYRTASSSPTGTQIPILGAHPSGGVAFNIVRWAANRYATYDIYDTNGTTRKSSIGYDFTNTSLDISNITGANSISLLDTGNIEIKPKSASSVVTRSDNFVIQTANVAQPGPAGHNSLITFNNSVGTARGYVYYKHCTGNDYDGTYLQSNSGAYFLCNSNGNLLLQAVGVPGKAFYAKSGTPINPPPAGREIAVKDDLTNLFNFAVFGTPNLYLTAPSQLWSIPVGVTQILVLLIGGGGGGGGGGSTETGAGGGGGGAGQRVLVRLNVTAGDVLWHVHGAGGAGGAQDVPGSTGGASYFRNQTRNNFIYLAAGGGGGGNGGSGSGFDVLDAYPGWGGSTTLGNSSFMAEKWADSSAYGAFRYNLESGLNNWCTAGLTNWATIGQITTLPTAYNGGTGQGPASRQGGDGANGAGGLMIFTANMPAGPGGAGGLGSKWLGYQRNPTAGSACPSINYGGGGGGGGGNRSDYYTGGRAGGAGAGGCSLVWYNV